MSTGPRDLARLALLANLDAAETCEAVNAAELELARHDDSLLASRLDIEDSIVSALVGAGHAVTLVNTAEHFADLARFVSEAPGCIVRDAGQSLASFRKEWRQARDADQRRAVELLTGALAIVNATDPPNFPKDGAP